MLLGAGASAEAGVPVTFEMTDRLAEKLSQRHPLRGPEPSALNFVCGALIAYDAAKGISPFRGLDVERVFAAIELLSERQTLEVTPFVSTWHPAVDTWDIRPRSAPAFFDDKLGKALLEGHGINPAGKLLVELIDSRIQSAATGKTYRELAELMLSELRDLVATTDKDVRYLSPLAIYGKRPSGLTITTLNYDLSIEHAAASAGVPLTTGIDDWVANGTWTWPTAGIRLLKLHGSINWAWSQTQHRDGHLPRQVVTVDPGDHTARPALIFGQRDKLKAEGPFLGLLAEFEMQLASARRLVAIGYSFRDDHVNELIRRWASEDIARTILVVDPNWPEAPEEGDFRVELQRHLIPPEWKDPAPFAPRLEVQRVTCSQALAALA